MLIILRVFVELSQKESFFVDKVEKPAANEAENVQVFEDGLKSEEDI
jgi:hypothetical protein